MGKKFTSENAREMQQRGAAKRKANELERKSARAIVDVLLNTKKKGKDGVERTYKEMMLQVMFKGAMDDGDLRKMDYLLRLIGESADNTTKIDLTTNGKDVTTPQIVFASAPLTEDDLQEIQDIRDGRKTESSNDISI
jgi:hypothetical protein